MPLPSEERFETEKLSKEVEFYKKSLENKPSNWNSPKVLTILISFLIAIGGAGGYIIKKYIESAQNLSKAQIEMSKVLAEAEKLKIEAETKVLEADIKEFEFKKKETKRKFNETEEMLDLEKTNLEDIKLKLKSEGLKLIALQEQTRMEVEKAKNSRSIADKEKANADIEKELAKKEKEELKRLQSLIKKEKEKTTKEVEDIRRKIEEEKKRVVAKTSMEIEDIKRKAKEEQKIAIKNARLAPLVVQINLLLEIEELDPFNNISESLILLVRNGGAEYEKEVLKKIDTIKSMTARGNLFYILFKAVNDKEKGELYLEKLIDFVRNEPEKLPNDFWNIFTFGEWDGYHAYVGEELIQIADENNLRDEIMSDVLQVLTDDRIYERSYLVRFRNKNNYFKALQFSRDLALNTALYYYQRKNGLEVLGLVEPEGFLIVAAKMLVDSSMNDKNKLDLYLSLYDEEILRSSSKIKVKQLKSDLNFPDEERFLSEWLSSEKVKPLVSKWIDSPDWKTLKQKYKGK